ncbi:MAG TPA: glycerol-3-phosphate dehydrogenase/oxidase [Leptospiraceae bacterium]|nr:glycerol-3-phosphate dehydrogenase/oxidase [Leptospiraceae bacterium]
MIHKREFHDLEKKFDLVVIGGGITGISVAREAAVRGIRVLCIEKNDFACATSSATSKLLHGGLRYLESYEFGLVRESLSERHIMGLAAGHLSRPMQFLVPMFEWSNPGRFIMQMGLSTYDLLAYDRNLGTPEDKQIPPAKWISREEFLKLEPKIESKGLKGGFVYYDYQSTYPERLALAFVKTAVQAGAVMLNHCQATGFGFKAGTKQIESVQIQDTLSGKEYTAKGSVFVNASGPWMDQVLGLAERSPLHKVQKSKGIHLLTDRIIGEQTLFLRNKKGQHCLLLPWEGMTLIGPTDSPYEGSPDDLSPVEEDITMLMDLVNELLPGRPLTREKIRHVPIGIRPLVFSGKSTYRASRKHEIYDHAADQDKIEGLVSVLGGKWTTSRKLGEDVLHACLPKLRSFSPGIQIKDVRTDREPLHGYPTFGASSTEIWEQIALMNHRVPDNVLNHLYTLYGTDYQEVLEIARKEPSLLKRISDEPGRYDIMAQIVYAVENESAHTLSDILSRRLALGSFGYPGDTAAKRAADLAGKLLKWSSSRKTEELKAYRLSYPLERLSTDSKKKK